MYFPEVDKPFSLIFTTYRKGYTLRGEFHYDTLEASQKALRKIRENAPRVDGLEIIGLMVVQNQGH